MYEAKKQPDTLNAAIARHVLTVKAEFVPLSQSRNAKEPHKTLNWRVTLQHKGRDVLTTDYSAGAAHCPSHKQTMTVQDALCVAYECENGIRAQFHNGRATNRGWKRIAPKTEDVIYSLLRDADALDFSSFEEFANDLGYDSDSRKAESIYRACLDIALKLRNALGESALAELRDATQDF